MIKTNINPFQTFDGYQQTFVGQSKYSSQSEVYPSKSHENEILFSQAASIDEIDFDKEVDKVISSYGNSINLDLKELKEPIKKILQIESEKAINHLYKYGDYIYDYDYSEYDYEYESEVEEEEENNELEMNNTQNFGIYLENVDKNNFQPDSININLFSVEPNSYYSMYMSNYYSCNLQNTKEATQREKNFLKLLNSKFRIKQSTQKLRENVIDQKESFYRNEANELSQFSMPNFQVSKNSEKVTNSFEKKQEMERENDNVSEKISNNEPAFNIFIRQPEAIRPNNNWSIHESENNQNFEPNLNLFDKQPETARENDNVSVQVRNNEPTFNFFNRQPEAIRPNNNWSIHESENDKNSEPNLNLFDKQPEKDKQDDNSFGSKDVNYSTDVNASGISELQPVKGRQIIDTFAPKREDDETVNQTTNFIQQPKEQQEDAREKSVTSQADLHPEAGSQIDSKNEARNDDETMKIAVHEPENSLSSKSSRSRSSSSLQITNPNNNKKENELERSAISSEKRRSEGKTGQKLKYLNKEEASPSDQEAEIPFLEEEEKGLDKHPEESKMYEQESVIKLSEEEEAKPSKEKRGEAQKDGAQQKVELPELEEEEEDVEPQPDKNKDQVARIESNKLDSTVESENSNKSQIEEAETETDSNSTPQNPSPAFSPKEPPKDESGNMRSPQRSRSRQQQQQAKLSKAESFRIHEPNFSTHSPHRSSSSRLSNSSTCSSSSVQLGSIVTAAPTEARKSATIITPNPEQVGTVSSSRGSQHLSVMAPKSIQVPVLQPSATDSATMKENSIRKKVQVTPELLKLKKMARSEESLAEIPAEQLHDLLCILNDERKTLAREHRYKEGLICNSTICHVNKFYEMAKKIQNCEDKKTEKSQCTRKIVIEKTDNSDKLSSLQKKLDFLLVQSRFKEAEEVQKLINIMMKEEEKLNSDDK